MVTVPAVGYERQGDVISRLDVGKLVLTKVRNNPSALCIQEGEARVAGGQILTGRQLNIRDDAQPRRDDRCRQEVVLRLFQGELRGLNLWVVLPQFPELCFGAAKVRLRRAKLGFRRA